MIDITTLENYEELKTFVKLKYLVGGEENIGQIINGLPDEVINNLFYRGYNIPTRVRRLDSISWYKARPSQFVGIMPSMIDALIRYDCKED